LKRIYRFRVEATLSVVITVINRDVCAVNEKELAERNLLGKLVNQFDEDIFRGEREVGEKPRERPL